MIQWWKVDYEPRMGFSFLQDQLLSVRVSLLLPVEERIKVGSFSALTLHAV